MYAHRRILCGVLYNVKVYPAPLIPALLLQGLIVIVVIVQRKYMAYMY